MTTRLLSPGETDAFDALAVGRGSLFNRPDWLRLFGPDIRKVGIFDDGNELIGGFAYREFRKFGLPMRMNPPFTPDCGPFLNIKAQHPVAVLEATRDGVSEMAAYLLRKAPAGQFLRLARGLSDVIPFIHSGFKAIPAYTYRIRLRRDEKELMSDMASVRRRNIQRAAKDGLLVREVTDYAVIRSLVLKTFARQGKGVDEGCISRILFEYANAGNSYAFATYNGDEAIACTFCVHDKAVSYYLLGGYDEEKSHGGAGPAAMWECIRRANTLGLEWFDFEGSMIPAIERYFRSFGGELTSFYTIGRGWYPVEVALKLVKRSYF